MEHNWFEPNKSISNEIHWNQIDSNRVQSNPIKSNAIPGNSDGFQIGLPDTFCDFQCDLNWIFHPRIFLHLWYLGQPDVFSAKSDSDGEWQSINLKESILQSNVDHTRMGWGWLGGKMWNFNVESSAADPIFVIFYNSYRGCCQEQPDVAQMVCQRK